MKLLFLDFDGVLHPSSPGKEPLFLKASLLSMALYDIDVPIIISSSWRFTHSMKELKENMIINIVSKISDMMMAKYNIKHKIYPICTNNEFICIFETYGKNITCPIFYHRSKKQGEQIIKINTIQGFTSYS